MERVLVNYTHGNGIVVDVTNPSDNRTNTAFVQFEDDDASLENNRADAEILVQEWLDNGAEGCEYYEGSTAGKSRVFENGIIVELCLP